MENDLKKLTKEENKKNKIGLLDVVMEKPLLAILLVIFIFYLLWYFSGGPRRTELKYNMTGWELVFKHFFRL